MRNSLRFKFVVGFLMIFVPLVFFLLFNNLYATNVVREQVSKTNSNLLQQHANQIDDMLGEATNFLNLLNENEAEVNPVDFLPFDSDDYMINKVMLFQRFKTTLNYFPLMDSYFLYNIRDNDLIFASKKDYYIQQDAIIDKMKSIRNQPQGQETREWQIIPTAKGDALIKTVRLSKNLFAGALVNTDTLLQTLKFLEMGDSGGAVIFSKTGELASDTILTDSQLEVINKTVLKPNDPFQTVTDPGGKGKFLLFGVPSMVADINYRVMIPEKSILQNLPFFRLAFYIVPLGGILLLVFYLILLRQVLLRPMKVLIQGMNRIMRGDLKIRLNENHSTEFAFLLGTFNNMVMQISDLKIDVYEEKIRTQDAEFGLLQVQIRPHFYLNSLNIIHSLAAIKEYSLIQKMTQHLAEYFRFIIQTKRGTVTLEAEIRHVQNYLEIQKLRFPNQLNYEIELPDPYRQAAVLPLTIQTFVENCVIHGFASRKELFLIRIKAYVEDQGIEPILWIEVIDNGIGFPEDILQKLQLGTYDNEIYKEGHLGIQNVMQRQRIHYDQKARLLFNNREKGAEIRIGIPLSFVNKEEDEDV
ncbi:sensor histidine kinase [Paenibacillus psychroresistens]|uniref:Sensor histidine kinase n=1 Tax=Paenibacillus psychroresistens TaxID=1778678 RepID=A0A6B8RDU3_9BACL|nr:sensor histidine kinase [Paenibacillus psychroresistens]QGQ94611.1 sensor histidine kinase [Paenibacillus psychroresistens]